VDHCWSVSLVKDERISLGHIRAVASVGEEAQDVCRAQGAAAGGTLYYCGSVKQILGPIGHRFEAIIVLALALSLFVVSRGMGSEPARA
jgi:hypothetical protein